MRECVPELPKTKRSRFVEQYQVSPYDAAVLANDMELARYFEAAAKDAKKPKNIANWILNDLQNALGGAGKAIHDCPIPPEALDELVNLIDSGKISGKQAKEVFAEMFVSGKRAAAIVQEKGIEQLSDVSAIEAVCDEVIAGRGLRKRFATRVAAAGSNARRTIRSAARSTRATDGSTGKNLR